MPIDTQAAPALSFDRVEPDVKPGRLRLCTENIGETNPVYTVADAGRQTGHPDLPVPPAFFHGNAGSVRNRITSAGIPLVCGGKFMM